MNPFSQLVEPLFLTSPWLRHQPVTAQYTIKALLFLTPSGLEGPTRTIAIQESQRTVVRSCTSQSRRAAEAARDLPRRLDVTRA